MSNKPTPDESVQSVVPHEPFVPAEAFHVAEYIADECEARGWDQSDLAERMGGSYEENMLTLELMKLEDPHLRLSEHMAKQLELAFGSSEATWLNLDKAWREHPTTQGQNNNTRSRANGRGERKC